jgi:16S rRNA G1207 methylase RsmC
MSFFAPGDRRVVGPDGRDVGAGVGVLGVAVQRVDGAAGLDGGGAESVLAVRATARAFVSMTRR